MFCRSLEGAGLDLAVGMCEGYYFLAAFCAFSLLNFCCQILSTDDSQSWQSQFLVFSLVGGLVTSLFNVVSTRLPILIYPLFSPPRAKS